LELFLIKLHGQQNCDMSSHPLYRESAKMKQKKSANQVDNAWKLVHQHRETIKSESVGNYKRFACSINWIFGCEHARTGLGRTSDVPYWKKTVDFVNCDNR